MNSLSSNNNASDSAMIDLNMFLLASGIIFTIGSLIALMVISRQVIKSRWIDKVSFVMLCIVWTTVLLLLAMLWISYGFYIGIF